MKNILDAAQHFARLSVAGTASAAKNRQFPTSEKPALTDVYPDRVTRWPGGVTSHADVVLFNTSGLSSYGGRYLYAAQEGRPKPLILYIHGGGWIAGHTRHSGALSNFRRCWHNWRAKALLLPALNIGLSGEAPFPAQLQDARAAIRFLKSNAGQYGIDATQPGVWGGSAGGHLAAFPPIVAA